jgi:hypothetical protein
MSENYSEIKDNDNFKKIKLSKTIFLDKIVNKIMSNKKIIYGVILFLLGIFIFCIYKGKRKNITNPS